MIGRRRGKHRITSDSQYIMGDNNRYIVRVEPEISAIKPEIWNALANPDGEAANPFITHQFLKALEDTGCVGEDSGWTPQHLILADESGDIRGCMPGYMKYHSQGEFVFDHGWAEAYHRAGGQYYPKLLSAVPFTPVTGRRFLVGQGPGSTKALALLSAAACQLTDRSGASSFHVNFLKREEWNELGSTGFLMRTDQQFQWQNGGYRTFDDYLDQLASRKRKAIKKERCTALSADIEIEILTGRDITERHWDAFYAFYMDTGARKWGHPYLNRAFFSNLSQSMPEQLLLIMASRAGHHIAGALNFIGGDTLYGRYWGCREDHKCLHFEICYYQAIDYAIRHGLAFVEAGAQGGHKLARGYLPKTTMSAHYIKDPNFRRAIAHYLEQERDYVDMERSELDQHSPFKKS